MEKQRIVNANEVSRFSAGSTIKGDVVTENDIRIDGCFEGSLYAEGKVVIGENARVKGSIICHYADFWGTVEGDSYIKETLILRSSSKVEGNINVKNLQVELNATINGACQVIDDDQFEEFVRSTVKKK